MMLIDQDAAQDAAQETANEATVPKPAGSVPEPESNWTDFADEIAEVVLEELEPSPFNTRVIREDEKLLELAESIRRTGVQQPIIIREVPIEGEVVKLEIVCGHRRWRASQLAGKLTIPAICRDLSDDEARALQITENLQREDLAPMDEATAFNDAITFAQGKMLTAQELAARLGKSPVYINRRLTLFDAIPDVQGALRGGLIEVGHALELARLPESEQERLLEWLNVSDKKVLCYECEDDRKDAVYEGEDGEAYCRACYAGGLVDDEEPGEPTRQAGERRPTSKSVLELRRHIQNTALRVLGDAPFDPNNRLLTEAGSCADCLKRTGASPLLFSDVRGEDICTDRDCYSAKVKAHIAARMAWFKSEKKPLHQISESWQTKGPQVHRTYEVTVVGAGTKRCGFVIEAIYIDGPKIGKIVEICVAGECKVHNGRYSSSSRDVSPAEKEKQQKERKAVLAKVKVEKDYRLALFRELIGKPLDPKPTDEMVRSLVSYAIGRFDSTKTGELAQALGWPKEFFGWQREASGALARLMEYSQAELLRIALVGLEANELTVHEHDVDRKNNAGKKPEIGLEKVARLIGVDAAKVRERVDPTPVKAPAKPAKPAKKAVTKKAAAKKTAVKKVKTKAVKAPATKAEK